jgi:hypothetical protein
VRERAMRGRGGTGNLGNKELQHSNRIKKNNDLGKIEKHYKKKKKTPVESNQKNRNIFIEERRGTGGRSTGQGAGGGDVIIFEAP